MRGWYRELRRRRVIRAAALYIVASWVAVQVATTVFPLLDLPVVAAKAVLGVAAVAFLPAMVLAWIFDIRTTPADSAEAPTAAASAPDGAGEGSRPSSIVVLPFENLTAEPSDEYFSDGLAEEITGALARIQALRVVSRTSAYSFRGKDVPVREIGNRLGVDFVLEGSVQRAGERLRLSIKLARVVDDRLVWAERFDRRLDDIFAVQDEITWSIVETIGVALNLGHLPGQVPARPTRSLQAYDLYLLGRHHWNLRTRAGLQRALELFGQAVELDPTYAPAYSGIADASALLASWQFASPAEMYPRAVAAARRALELDPLSAEAHASIGFVKLNWEWQWGEAEMEFRRALELNASQENACRWLSAFLAGVGRDDEALDIALKVVALDPLSVLPRMNVGMVHYLAGRHAEAVREWRQVLAMDPAFVRAKIFLAGALSLLGRHDEGIALAVEAAGNSPPDDFIRVVIPLSLALAGRAQEARAALEPLRPKLPWLYRAMVHAALGEVDEMYDALERARVERDDWMYSLGTQPMFRPWRDEPRFREIVGRLGLPGAPAALSSASQG